MQLFGVRRLRSSIERMPDYSAAGLRLIRLVVL